MLNISKIKRILIPVSFVMALSLSMGQSIANAQIFEQDIKGESAQQQGEPVITVKERVLERAKVAAMNGCPTDIKSTVVIKNSTPESADLTVNTALLKNVVLTPIPPDSNFNLPDNQPKVMKFQNSSYWQWTVQAHTHTDMSKLQETVNNLLESPAGHADRNLTKQRLALTAEMDNDILTDTTANAPTKLTDNLRKQDALILFAKVKKLMDEPHELGDVSKQNLATINQVIELYPEYADSYVYRGRLYFGANNQPAGLAEYQRAITINNSMLAKFYLGLHYKNNLRDYKTAIDYFLKVVEQEPEFPRVYFYIGDIFENNLGKAYLEQALEYYTKYMAYSNQESGRKVVNARIANIKTQLGR